MEKLRPPVPRGGFGRRQAEPTPELKLALDHVQRNEAKAAALQSQSADFARFVTEITDWARVADPWTPMSAEQAAQLNAAYERSHAEFKDLARFRVPSRLDDIESETLRAMITGEERAFSAMPEPMRELINGSYLLPANFWHQMFGTGVDIQGNAAVENEGNVMLLQLVYDDMLELALRRQRRLPVLDPAGGPRGRTVEGGPRDVRDALAPAWAPEFLTSAMSHALSRMPGGRPRT